MKVQQGVLAVVITTCIALGTLGAQVGGGPSRAAQDRRMGQIIAIEGAFAARLQRELGLDAPTYGHFREVLSEWGRVRAGLDVVEQQLRVALNRQLRPGVAASADSVTGLIDRLLQNRVEYAQAFQGEMRALDPLLTPVQRGQYLQLRDQLLQRVRQIQAERGMLPGALPERRNRP
jgi:hypothetical protein